MCLLEKFEAFRQEKRELAARTDDDDNEDCEQEPPFEDFVDWLINKDDYSVKSVTQHAQSVSYDVDMSAFCEVIDLVSD